MPNLFGYGAAAELFPEGILLFSTVFRHKTCPIPIIILKVMHLTQVIYADVLFLLNTYITYALILLTALISGRSSSRLRMALASLAGGLYSLIILIPCISDSILTFSRLPAAFIFIAIGFGRVPPKTFARLFCSFFLVNFIFAGLMTALWYLAAPTNIYMGGFVVYFDIKPLTLIMLTAICYFIIKGINLAVKIRQPKNTIFDMELHINDKVTALKAFYDTGNSLTDPFTGKAVIIVSRYVLKNIFPEDKELFASAQKENITLRFLPCSGVTGSRLLPCFKADKVCLKSISHRVTIDEPVIALTQEAINGGSFGAILPKDIFINEKGEIYYEDKQLVFTDKK